MILIILSGFFILKTKNPLHAILGLILVFLNSAIFLLSLNVNFLALVYVVIYVGAICVLFLFVVMLLNIRSSEMRSITMYKNEIYPFLISFLLYLIGYIYLVSTNISRDHSVLNMIILTTDIHSATVITAYILQNTLVFILLTLILYLAILSPIVIASKRQTLKKKEDIFYTITRNLNTVIQIQSQKPVAMFSLFSCTLDDSTLADRQFIWLFVVVCWCLFWLFLVLPVPTIFIATFILSVVFLIRCSDVIFAFVILVLLFPAIRSVISFLAESWRSAKNGKKRPKKF